MIWLVLSAAVIVAGGLLWWFAWLRRNQKSRKPTQPYREWQD